MAARQYCMNNSHVGLEIYGSFMTENRKRPAHNTKTSIKEVDLEYIIRRQIFFSPL